MWKPEPIKLRDWNPSRVVFEPKQEEKMMPKMHNRKKPEECEKHVRVNEMGGGRYDFYEISDFPRTSTAKHCLIFPSRVTRRSDVCDIKIPCLSSSPERN